MFLHGSIPSWGFWDPGLGSQISSLLDSASIPVARKSYRLKSYWPCHQLTKRLGACHRRLSQLGALWGLNRGDHRTCLFPVRNSSPVLSVAPWLKVIGLNIFREVPLHALLVSGTLGDYMETIRASSSRPACLKGKKQNVCLVFCFRTSLSGHFLKFLEACIILASSRTSEITYPYHSFAMERQAEEKHLPWSPDFRWELFGEKRKSWENLK